MLKYFVYVSCVCLALLFKLVPHLPNFSPEIVFSLYFLANYKKLTAIMGMLFMWLICDVGYALIYGYSIFGSWSIFTYSALFLFFSFFCFYKIKNKIKVNNKKFIFLSIAATLFYWLWTNLGVWLLSGMYRYDFSGLVSCYYLALPFLTYSLLSSIFWAILVCMLFFNFSNIFCKSEQNIYVL